MDTLPVSTVGSQATGDTTEVVGYSKPLHRFIRADPKSIGVTMVILGGSQFITGILMMPDNMGGAPVYSGLWLGTLFLICGILYFLSGNSPSKKLVTASLALSIIASITGALAFMSILATFLIHLREGVYYDGYDTSYINLTNIDDGFWRTFHKDQVSCVECVWLLHCFVGGVILIVMTAFSRAALRSTKMQATVIMYNQPTA